MLTFFMVAIKALDMIEPSTFQQQTSKTDR